MVVAMVRSSTDTRIRDGHYDSADYQDGRMKYKDIYADSQAGSYPEPTLERTKRVYACDACKERTVWRDWTSGFTVPVCSVECRLAVINNFLEVDKEEQNVNSEVRDS